MINSLFKMMAKITRKKSYSAQHPEVLDLLDPIHTETLVEAAETKEGGQR